MTGYNGGVDKYRRELELYPSAMTSAEWAEMEPAVRNNAFFSACVEDERVLAALKKLVDEALAEGLSPQEFVRRALLMLEAIRLTPPEDGAEREVFEKSVEILYDPERLRLILRTQEQMASGYAAFCKAFERVQLLLNPGWRFVRQPGAKTKRDDHVKHEGAVRLKTDWQFWLARNDPAFGGFGNPYAPFGFNSWMRTFPVSREECEKLGLLKPGEKVTIPDELFNWNLPETLRQMGTASTAELPKDAVDRIIDRCKDEGVQVEPVPGEERVQVVPPPELDDKLVDAVVDDMLSPKPEGEPVPQPVPEVKPEGGDVPERVPVEPQTPRVPRPEPQTPREPKPVPQPVPKPEPEPRPVPQPEPKRPNVVQLPDDEDGLTPELLGRWPRAVMVTILRNKRAYRRFAARNVRTAEKLGYEETAELEKRWPGYQWTFRVGTDAVLGANPHGCNQHEHGEGCEKKSGQVNGKGLEQSERRKDGEDDKEADRRADSRSEEERSGGDLRLARRQAGAYADFKQGGDSGSGRELGQRVSLSEACRGVLEESARLLFGEEGNSELVEELYYPTVAQLNAVVDGRKPAFFESFEPMMDGLAATVPPGSGLRYVKGAQGQCIYHPDAVRRVLGTDAEGEKLDARVRELVDSGHSGRILGYGYDEFEQPPGRRVRITLNGDVVAGFVVPPDEEMAEKVVTERVSDFELAFPGKEWGVRYEND